MVRDVFVFSLIMFFMMAAPVRAGLSASDIAKTYAHPWTVISSWLHKMKPLNPDTGFDLKADCAVQTLRFQIPGGQQQRLTPFGSPLTSFEGVTILKPQHSAEDKKHPELVLFVMVVDDNKGKRHVALPSFLSPQEGAPAAKKLLEIQGRVHHAALATRSEVEGAHYRSHIDKETGAREINDYSQLAQGDYSDERTTAFYKKGRRYLFDLVVKSVKNRADLARKAKSGITLVCLGCGGGREVVLGRQKLADGLGCHVYSLGVERNLKLVESSHQRLSDYLGGGLSKIVEGNALQASRFIKQALHAKGADQESKGLVVVTAIGLLSESVLEGTYPALRVLQDVARDGHVDLLLVMNYEASLFTRESLGASGWQVSRHLIPPEVLYDSAPRQTDVQRMNDQIWVMTPLPRKMNLERVVAQSRCRSSEPDAELTLLDLSMTTAPSVLFDDLVAQGEYGHITTVDVSWSGLREGEIAGFSSKMQAQGVTTLVVSGHEPWFDALMAHIQKHNMFDIEKRTDCEEANEIPSIPQELRIGICGRGTVSKPFWQRIRSDE